MNANQFVEAAKKQTIDSVVNSTSNFLEKIPGQRPSQEDINLSRWYGALNEEGKAAARKLIRASAHAATFAFLCILDGVKFVEDDQVKGHLELKYIGDKQVVLLNDPQNEELHNLLNGTK